MASAIALYPASLGWRWSQESYSGRVSCESSYDPAALSGSAGVFIARHYPSKSPRLLHTCSNVNYLTLPLYMLC
jgi:hypothetical protein